MICCTGEFQSVLRFDGDDHLLTPIKEIPLLNEKPPDADHPGRDWNIRVCQVRFCDSPDRGIAVGGYGSNWGSSGGIPVRYVDLESQAVTVCASHRGEVWGLASIPSTMSANPRVISGSFTDAKVLVSDAVEGKVVAAFRNPEEYTPKIHYVPEWPGKFFIGSAFARCCIYVCDLQKESSSSARLMGHKHWVDGISASVSRNLLFSGSRDKTARFWSMENSQCQHVCPLTEPARSCCFDERRNALFVGLTQGLVEKFDIRRPKHHLDIFRLPDSDDNPDMCQLDDNRFVSPGVSHIVAWNAETGKAKSRKLDLPDEAGKKVFGVCDVQGDVLDVVELEMLEERVDYLAERVLAEGPCLQMVLQGQQLRSFRSLL